MNLSRRRALALGGAVVTVSLVPVSMAFALTEETQGVIDAFTGGAAVAEGGVTLIMPELAENGGAVPMTVAAPGAVSIVIVADGNPRPEVITFNFEELSGNSEASTRIRLAQTQSVIAVAEMADGSFASTSVEVSVTLGGCG